MKFLMKFDMDSEAFYPAGELEAARLLERVASQLRDGAMKGNIIDSYGKTVGCFAILGQQDSKRSDKKAFADFLDSLLLG